ncbi:monooxygenase [Parachaetomium inaequale]|uniref:Monooxygenase n=1 Tax=Parachaetomium inaequale TaxID=2588326 RepID=A0AAN6PHG1_9PEZI|nr:monooxygenase [Parachaetomium inaequale]
MATNREYRGFHIDTVARIIRKTLLNEWLALPVAAAIARFNIDLTRLSLAQVARVALYLGSTGLLLSANTFLNKWAANNWTASRPGEWAHWEREIVVVTGGSSGIGAQVVKGLLARNPRTQIVIIDLAPLAWTPPAGMLGTNLHYYQADLSKPDAIRAVCARVRDEVGHPTVLVNNAGLVRGFSVLEGSYSDVEVTLKTNLTAPFLLIKEFLPDMVRNNHGHIVGVCSTSALMPPPDIVDYAASKAGVQALYEGLGMELRWRYNAPRVRLTNGVFNFIRTPLLSGNPSQPQFLAPILHVETVGEAIVDALYSGFGGVIYLPGIMRYIAMLSLAIIVLSDSHQPPTTMTPATSDSGPSESPTYTTFACIGTGFSGICLGATLARWHPSSGHDTQEPSLRLFSRDPDLGGTWLANAYPGAACDVPSALYSFSFASNPDWSRVLPPAGELHAYLGRVADAYGVREKTVFGVEIFRCKWVEERGRWRLWGRDLKKEKDGEGEVFVHECRFLFSGAGHFTQPRELGVPGLEGFGGEVFHSVRWRGDVDLAGKRVVLFGNGCTAAQIVPAIVGRTGHLTQVVRSKHWVYPPIDKRMPEAAKALLRVVPGLATAQRFLVYFLAEVDWKGFKLTEAGAKFRKSKRRKVEEYMRKTAPEKYHDILIPDFEVGCKRRIFDSNYLESLHAENLTLTNEGVTEILPNGVRMQSGEVVEADVIILANGFTTNQYLGGVEVIGQDGETLEEHWGSFGGPEAYNCTAVSGFPNMFFLLGPNTATGHTSAIMAIENAVNYSLRVLQPVLEGRASVANLKRSAEEDYANRMQSALKGTVWMSGCNNWYTRGPGGKVWNGMTYPWSQARYWYESLFPVWQDWEYTGKSDPVIVKRRDFGLWFLNFAVLMAAGLFAWARKNPDSLVASVIVSQASAALPGWKTWALGLLPKLRQS